MPDLGQVLSLFATPALCGAAVTDMRSRRIPNVLPLVVAAAGVSARAASGDAGLSLVLAGGVFAALYVLWLRGLLGGGDVKLLSACVLLVPAGAVAALLGAVAVSGGGLGLAYLLLRALPPFAAPRLPRWSPRRLCRVEAWRMRRGGPLPYACAIAAGCLFTLVAG